MGKEWECDHMKKCSLWNAEAYRDSDTLMYCPCPFKVQTVKSPGAQTPQKTCADSNKENINDSEEPK